MTYQPQTPIEIAIVNEHILYALMAILEKRKSKSFRLTVDDKVRLFSTSFVKLDSDLEGVTVELIPLEEGMTPGGYYRKSHEAKETE